MKELKMLALRLRSKSRGRSNSRSRIKKRDNHELAGVPAIVTICKNNTDYEERIQVQKSKKARNKKRSDNLPKKSVNQHVTRPPIATTKCNAFKSNPPPDNRGSDTKRKSSTSKNHKKLSTSNALSAETSSNSSSGTNSPQNCQQDNPKKTNTETTSGWRETVSNIIGTGRSRSKSLSRSKSQETSKKVVASKISTGVNKSKNSSNNSSCVEDGSDLKWHHTIMKHDWDVIRTMLKSYDHTKFRQRSTSMGRLRYPLVRQEISPLLHVDANGRTPLHLACKERMPSRLLRRLLFVERNAASVQDNFGRYPLHLVAMNSLDQHILDRLIHASPNSLGIPDHLNHTPIQYAVLKADLSRGNKEVMWGPPRTKVQAERQKLLTDAYQSVVFILESMIKRRKVLCIVHESQILIKAVELFAPPEVVDLMVILSDKILRKDQNMSERLVDLVFQLNHPLNVIHRVLETASKIILAANLLETVRERLTDHFTEDCNGTTSKESRERKVTTSFAKQFAKVQKEGRTSSACKDWWDKLRYLIARSSDRTSNWKDDTVLHMALCNPKSHPSMIEYLCRLKPAARYKRDDVTGALPIHLACMHWHPEKYGIGSESSHKKVLNLLLAGDFDLVRTKYHGRTALHYAALNGKSMPYIQSLLNENQETASIPDPETKLLPFQLAAISEKYDSDKPTLQLDTIYFLLRANPTVVSTPHEIIDQKQKGTRLLLGMCSNSS